MALVEIIDLAVRGDERGLLVPVEGGTDIPFQIRRIYYLYGTNPGVRRGLHAHRRLRQAAICVRGRCNMLLDDGHNKATVMLDSPSRALMIEPMIWHEMFDFSNDAVLLVLANDLYDEGDYIRSRAQFDQLVHTESTSP